MEIKEFLTSNRSKSFYWTTVVNALGLGAFYLTGSDWVYAAPALALLNGVTKYLNQTYLK